jgi:GntR family transcriptional regulator, transcriptional repressor for pyruvate dehydrogenase complex
MHFSAVLGVSRPVVREAFGVLAALKLIDVGSGRRPRVGAIDGSILAASLSHAVDTAQISIAEIWDARRTIEKRAAGLAAVLRTDAEARDILTIARSMAAVQEDHEELSRRDVAFHRAIVAASHNGVFVQFLDSFGPMMAMSVPTAWRTRITKQDRHRALEHHLELAKAIVLKDANAAEAAMEEHFEKAVGVIFELMLESCPE